MYNITYYGGHTTIRLKCGKHVGTFLRLVMEGMKKPRQIFKNTISTASNSHKIEKAHLSLK